MTDPNKKQDRYRFIPVQVEGSGPEFTEFISISDSVKIKLLESACLTLTTLSNHSGHEIGDNLTSAIIDSAVNNISLVKEAIEGEQETEKARIKMDEFRNLFREKKDNVSSKPANW